jgi:hypothetical protein
MFSRNISSLFRRSLTVSAVRPIQTTGSVELGQTGSVKMSKSDSELVNYVNYQLENERDRALPTLNGWSPCETTGALGVITKDHGAEKITVRFMVNGIMPTLEEQDRLEEEGQEVLWYCTKRTQMYIIDIYSVILNLK